MQSDTNGVDLRVSVLEEKDYSLRRTLGFSPVHILDSGAKRKGAGAELCSSPGPAKVTSSPALLGPSGLEGPHLRRKTRLGEGRPNSELLFCAQFFADSYIVWIEKKRS